MDSNIDDATINPTEDNDPEEAVEVDENIIVEEPAVLIKPKDLTFDSEELRYIGWNIPLECNNIEVGSIIAIFCPELRYLMHT